EDLPVHTFESFGQLEAKIPTEVLITDRREYELAEEGFIALTMRKGSDNAAFFSANSVQNAAITPRSSPPTRCRSPSSPRTPRKAKKRKPTTSWVPSCLT